MVCALVVMTVLRTSGTIPPQSAIRSNSRWGFGDDAVDHLPGEFGPRRLGEYLLAHPGADAVGTDHQVVAFAPAVAERDVNAVRLLRHRLDRRAQSNIRARGKRALREYPVQRRTQDAAGPRQIIGYRRDIHFLDRLATASEDVGPVPGGALGLHFIEYTERLQRPQCRAGDRDAGTLDFPVRIDLHQIDLHVSAAHADGAGHAPHPNTHDEHCGAASQWVTRGGADGSRDRCQPLPCRVEAQAAG